MSSAAAAVAPPWLCDMEYYGHLDELEEHLSPGELEDLLEYYSQASPVVRLATPVAPASTPGKSHQNSNLTSPGPPIYTPGSSADREGQEDAENAGAESLSSALASDENNSVFDPLQDLDVDNTSNRVLMDSFSTVGDVPHSLTVAQTPVSATTSSDQPSAWPHSAQNTMQWVNAGHTPGYGQVPYVGINLPTSHPYQSAESTPQTGKPFAMLGGAFQEASQFQSDGKQDVATGDCRGMPHQAFDNSDPQNHQHQNFFSPLGQAYQVATYRQFSSTGAFHLVQTQIIMPPRSVAAGSFQSQQSPNVYNQSSRSTPIALPIGYVPSTARAEASIPVSSMPTSRGQDTRTSTTPSTPTLHVNIPNTQRLNRLESPPPQPPILAGQPKISPGAPSNISESAGSPVMRRSNIANRNRGGRRPGMHLNDTKKKKVANMRTQGACWTCALQRDPCQEGDPCPRCKAQSRRARPSHFGCDRSKLWELVDDFLPSSMTLMHTKHTILETISQSVGAIASRKISVLLTCGTGPELLWDLCEFAPRDSELTVQYQYRKDSHTGICRRVERRSLNLMIEKLDGIDADVFSKWLDVMLEPQYLEHDFAWKCFEEEDDPFQATLLREMCTLFLNLHDDDDLLPLLRQILRMVIVTYIMGHTLTIAEETLPDVLGQLRYTNGRDTAYNGPFLSPRLANRQFKLFFSTIRNRMYNVVLKALHSILRGTKKSATWLSAFCIMIGLAMVLEEDQRTLHIQADAKWAKKEPGWEMATEMACRSCTRIDERFRFLLMLFHGKYKGKNFDHGTFGPNTPTLEGELERRFTESVYRLLQEKRLYLANRAKLEISPHNQTSYTSRLVARFLLPFINYTGAR